MINTEFYICCCFTVPNYQCCFWWVTLWSEPLIQWTRASLQITPCLALLLLLCFQPTPVAQPAHMFALELKVCSQKVFRLLCQCWGFYQIPPPLSGLTTVHKVLRFYVQTTQWLWSEWMCWEGFHPAQQQVTMVLWQQDSSDQSDMRIFFFYI